MQQVLTVNATGLAVGWLARTAMRSRAFGLVGDLTIGRTNATGSTRTAITKSTFGPNCRSSPYTRSWISLAPWN